MGAAKAGEGGELGASRAGGACECVISGYCTAVSKGEVGSVHENVARVRMSSLTNTTLKDRMQALSVATTGVMPPVLKEAIDNWYKSEPFPEWVLFIMLIRLNSYYQFYDREGMVLWNAVVRKFKYELRVANALAFADIPLMAATNRIDNIDTAEQLYSA